MPDLANAPIFAVQLYNVDGLPLDDISNQIQLQLAFLVYITPTMLRTTDALIASTKVVTIGAWIDGGNDVPPAEAAARAAWIATVTSEKSILLESQSAPEATLATFSYFLSLVGLNTIVAAQLAYYGPTEEVAPKVEVLVSSAVASLNPAQKQLTTTIRGKVTAPSVRDIHVILTRTDTLGIGPGLDGRGQLVITGSSTSGNADEGDMAALMFEGLVNPVAGTVGVVVGTLIDRRILPHDVDSAAKVLIAAFPTVLLTPAFGDGDGKITFDFFPPVLAPGYLLFGTLALPAPRQLSATVIGPAQVTIGVGAKTVPVYRVEVTDLHLPDDPDQPSFAVAWKADSSTVVFERAAAGSHSVYAHFAPPPGAVNGTTTHHTIYAVCGPDVDGVSVTSTPFGVTTVVDTLKNVPLPTRPRPISQK